MSDSYASFWQRLGASLIDALVLWPIGYLAYEGDSKAWLLLDSTASTFVMTAYTVVLHARYGQTVGKWVTGVRVLAVDGAPIGWRTATLRNGVDIIMNAAFVVHLAVYLARVPDAHFYGVDATARERHLLNDGAYLYWLAPAVLIWTFSEVVVMLFNQRRRSIHDFIAGTVVVSGRSRRLRSEAHA